MTLSLSVVSFYSRVEERLRNEGARRLESPYQATRVRYSYSVSIYRNISSTLLLLCTENILSSFLSLSLINHVQEMQSRVAYRKQSAIQEAPPSLLSFHLFQSF